MCNSSTSLSLPKSVLVSEVSHNTTNWVTLNRNLLTLSWFWRLEIHNKAVARVILIWKFLGEHLWLPETLGISCFADALIWYLPLLSHCIVPMYLCVQISLLIKRPVFALGPTVIQYNLISTWLEWQKPYLQMRTCCQVLGVRNPHLLEDTI